MEVPAFQRERLELEAVLASPEFRRAPVLSRILSYICEQYFHGHGDNLKEYNIAVEVLGKPPDFDPGADSIVRTHVTRLRKRLEEYYDHGDGAGHALKITLSPAGYMPLFIENARNGGGSSSPRRRLAFLGWPPTPLRFVALSVLVVVPLLALLVFRNDPDQKLAVRAGSPLPVNAAAIVPSGAAADGLRILVGLTDKEWFDSSGMRWSQDQYYSGGAVFDRRDRHILRTQDERLYQSPREGDFRYDIPVENRPHEIRLHFAETYYKEPDPWSGWEYGRVFNVLVNGKPVLENFDIAADARGLNAATIRVLRDVMPSADGRISLEFKSVLNRALLNAIEVLPMRNGRTEPVRILCGSPRPVEADGKLWLSDRFFVGGRPSRSWRPLLPGYKSQLYEYNRWGAFSYIIPVAPGTYTVSLYFAELHFGSGNTGAGGEGERVFDIYCNHERLEKGLDVMREAKGPNRPLVRTYRGLRPNADGKLQIDFVRVRDYPNLFAIEVIEEAN